ncbi:MAG: hypothetical protein EA419_10970 [Wenzhouxiangella sp.]|nr:MAG: hypothetical protein EA370_04760 [Wenzhouxiangella sp.]TVS10313.1 MAG: hypothetical protein EA419_10970 [Wenzhouxiangella sp.]
MLQTLLKGRKNLICLIATLAWLTLASPAQATDPGLGEPPFRLLGYASPTIDGVFDPAEWAEAAVFPIMVAMPPSEGGGERLAMLFIANDSENLYVALRLALEQETRVNLTLAFDNDLTGELDLFDEQFGAIAGANHPPNFFFDNVYAEFNDGVGFVSDTFLGGTVDGDVEWTHDGEFLTIEMFKPLDSGDIYDFSLSPGSVAGVWANILVLPAPLEEDPIGTSTTPFDFALLGHLMIVPEAPMPTLNEHQQVLIGPEGDGVNALRRIQAPILADDGNLFVAACRSNNVFRVNTQDEVLHIFDGTADPLFPCECPGAVALSTDEFVIVPCRNNDKVFVLIPDADDPDVYNPLEILTEQERGGIPMQSPRAAAARELEGGGVEVFVVAADSRNVLRWGGAPIAVEVLGPEGIDDGIPLSHPWDLMLDDQDNLLIVDFSPETPGIYQIDPAGSITRIIGADGDGLTPVGHALAGVAVDANGSRYTYDLGGTLFRITADGDIANIATFMDLTEPPTTHRIAIDESDNLYLGGRGGIVFRVSPLGVVQPINLGSAHETRYPLVDLAGRLYGEGIGADLLVRRVLPPSTNPIDLPEGIEPGDLFGASLATNGSQVAVGLPGKNSGRGRVDIYELEDAKLKLRASIEPPAARASEQFGKALAFDKENRERLLIAAPKSSASRGQDGDYLHAALYEFDETFEQAALVEEFAPDPDDADARFGAAVAIAGDWVAIGAPDADGSKGVVYTYSPLATTGPRPRRRIQASDLGVSGIGEAGSAVDLAVLDSIAVLATGSPSATVGALLSGSASLTTLSFSSGGPVFGLSTIVSPPANMIADGMGFGRTVRVRRSAGGIRALFGAPSALGDVGLAFFLALWSPDNGGERNTPLPLQVIESGEAGSAGRFGSALDLSDRGLVIGAPGLDGQAGRLFRFNADGQLIDEVRALSGTRAFGSSVAIMDDGIASGAPESNQNTGSVAFVDLPAIVDMIFADSFKAQK